MVEHNAQGYTVDGVTTESLLKKKIIILVYFYRNRFFEGLLVFCCFLQYVLKSNDTLWRRKSNLEKSVKMHLTSSDNNTPREN